MLGAGNITLVDQGSVTYGLTDDGGRGLFDSGLSDGGLVIVVRLVAAH